MQARFVHTVFTELIRVPPTPIELTLASLGNSHCRQQLSISLAQSELSATLKSDIVVKVNSSKRE